MRMVCTEDGKKQAGQARDGDQARSAEGKVLGGWSGLNCFCLKDISRSSVCDLIWKRDLCRGWVLNSTNVLIKDRKRENTEETAI